MKIGIVTFFRAPNYGAMLQARALWCYLKGRGHEVYFVDHDFGGEHPQPLWRCLIARNVNAIKTKLRHYVRHGCTLFSSESPVAPLTFPFDAVIVGSDQMWNPNWMEPHFPIVFLSFAKCKRLSYAVSFGVRKWDGSKKGEVSRWLGDFDAIGVREDSAVDIVRDLCGRQAEIVPDPTLLWSASFYQKFADSKSKSKVPYIFSFFLDEFVVGDEDRLCSKVVADALGIQSVCHAYDYGSFPLSLYCRLLGVRGKISVSEWLAKIMHASFVITNSFHGTVFSILFRRPFVVFGHTGKSAGMNDRLLTLLNHLKLAHRIVSLQDVGKIPSLVNESIDWGGVEDAIGSMRASADNFFDKVGL